MEQARLDELPNAYRIALRLKALGADDYLIADCLGIDPDGVTALLDIGTGKLERLQQASPSDNPRVAATFIRCKRLDG